MNTSIHQNRTLVQLQNSFHVRPTTEVIDNRLRVRFVVEKQGVEFARRSTREEATEAARILSLGGQVALTKEYAHQAVSNYRQRRLG